jgi:hypothetical protein
MANALPILVHNSTTAAFHFRSILAVWSSAHHTSVNLWMKFRIYLVSKFLHAFPSALMVDAMH